MEEGDLMDFGMPTLIENRDLYENVALCKSLGLDFIELNMNLPDYQVENLEKTKVFQEIIRQNNIYFTIHLDENLNIADFNKAVADAYMETVKRAIDVAHKLNVPILNMHMNHGVHFTLPDRKIQLFEQYFDEYITAIRQFISICEREIGDSDIKVCIENTDGYRSYEKAAIEEILLSRVFALTWDIGHSNASGNADEPFILQNEERLRHFHIHDSLGKKVHMTLGDGEINLEQKLEIARRRKCRCVVETKTIASLKDSVLWLKNNYSL